MKIAKNHSKYERKKIKNKQLSKKKLKTSREEIATRQLLLERQENY